MQKQFEIKNLHYPLLLFEKLLKILKDLSIRAREVFS